MAGWMDTPTRRLLCMDQCQNYQPQLVGLELFMIILILCVYIEINAKVNSNMLLYLKMISMKVYFTNGLNSRK